MAKRRLIQNEDKVLEGQLVAEVAADQSVALMPEIEQPAKIPTGFRRFAVGEGVSLSHGKAIYASSPEGWIDLPSGEDWYSPMIQSGVLKELFDEPQTELA